MKATVLIGREDAALIMSRNSGKVRVGLVSVKLKERTPDVRCRKCWGTGHLEKDCNERARPKL